MDNAAAAANADAFSPNNFAPISGDDHQLRAGSEARNFDTVKRIPVLVQVVLGSATMPVSALIKLGRGAVVPLDHRVGEPVDVVVNGRIIARGEVVVVEDDNSRFGVQLTEIVGPSTEEEDL
nr:flagellar motor switch protein FliN [Pseudochelatococcus contaminans]